MKENHPEEKEKSEQSVKLAITEENLIFVYSLAGRLFYSRIDLLSYLSSVLSWRSLWSQKLVEDKILVLSKYIVTFEFKDVCFCHSILVD